MELCQNSSHNNIQNFKSDFWNESRTNTGDAAESQFSSPPMNSLMALLKNNLQSVDKTLGDLFQWVEGEQDVASNSEIRERYSAFKLYRIL